MKVAVMTAKGKMGFETRSTPVPGPYEVLVKLEYVGICGSDLHYYENGAIGDYVVKPPFVLGHEAAGKVVQIGEKVRHLRYGDRVALEPGKTCGKCEYCKQGKYNLCPDVVFFATPPVDGVFQEYVAHPEDLCFRLPDNMGTLEGALIEPLAVGFHAAITGGARIGQTALVMGAGCIGLVSMMALKAMGVSHVYVSDVLDNRLQKAKELGAAVVLRPAEEEVPAVVEWLTHGRGVDLTIDTTGSDEALKLAVDCSKKGATITMVGYSKSGDITLPLGKMLDKELTLKTIFRYRHIYPLAIQAVSDGKVNLKGLVTKVFDLDDIQEAMDQSVRNKAEIVKSVVRI
jgi:L-iditol 2-dehydrogenase